MTTPASIIQQNAFLSGIGHICLQWALLEQTLLAIIGAAEDLPFDKVYTRFGSLDMQPRLNMALKLAREDKWPPRLIKTLVEIRKALQKDGGGLAERRNLFIHGVHKDTDVPGEVSLTMARWSPDKREQIVTMHDAFELATHLTQLVHKAESVFRGYGVWKFGAEYQADRSEQIAGTKATARFIRAKQIKRALKLLLANLKPW